MLPWVWAHQLEQGQPTKEHTLPYIKYTPLAASPQGFSNCAVGFVFGLVLGIELSLLHANCTRYH